MPGYTLEPLPYPFNALEPHIDARTMEIHHDKHHAAYIAKANDALKGTEWEGKPVTQVIANLSALPDNIRTAVRNNGGGHANHSLFWKVMAPPSQGAGGKPAGDLAQAIDQTFGSFDKFKEQFSNAAATRFGSGWAWLVVKAGKLAVCSTANQDSPLMGDGVAGCSGTPILGLDVWEHAYYLNYQNKRPDYVAAWWNVVNWPEVGKNYTNAK
jgi:Fe-Mn family superoxide dismutase